MTRIHAVLETCQDNSLDDLDLDAATQVEPAHQAVRLELICRIRKLIESGQYDTDQRLQGALDRLLDSMM